MKDFYFQHDFLNESANVTVREAYAEGSLENRIQVRDLFRNVVRKGKNHLYTSIGSLFLCVLDAQECCEIVS